MQLMTTTMASASSDIQAANDISANHSMDNFPFSQYDDHNRMIPVFL
jgi:hypothetical protein